MKTYGSITYNKRRKAWEITCEPHVSIRLKRIFARISTWEFGKLYLSATPENSRDLIWAGSRYPMLMSPEDRTRLEELGKEQENKEDLVNQFLEGKKLPTEFKLKLPPREYQALAANLWIATGGLLVVDDVGLGKTISALAGLSDPRLLPALVVTLTHLPFQWQAEINKFTGLTSHILKRGQPYDITKYHNGVFPDIIISNYHKLEGWAETLAPLCNGLVLDECHELRHRDSQRYAAAQHLAAHIKYRLGLSATPLFNYGGEIFNVLEIISPGSLGTWEEFNREWCTYDSDKNRIKDPRSFGVYVKESGLMLRRTRNEVKRELPPVTVVPHYIDVDLSVLNKLKGEAIDLALLILKQKQEYKGQKMLASAEFDMKMRMATGIAKAPFIADFVKFLVEETNEPVVVYAWHREVYSILQERLKALNPVMYTGSETPLQKEESKQAFLSGKSKVLLISLRAGAGLDGLQEVCHICVFGEIDWSPAVHHQALGRIHRDGQDDPVTAYYLLAETGSDPFISDILGIKKQQFEGVVNPDQDLVEKLQVNKDGIRELALRYLNEQGVSVPKEDSAESPSE